MRVQTDRIVLFAKVSMAANMLMALIKLLVGVYSLSIFMGLNAFYSAGMGFAKLLFLNGYKKDMGKTEQRFYYSTIGIVILLSSIVYVFYSMRMFAGISGGSAFYTKTVAIIIGVITFAEIGINVKGSLALRKTGEPLLQAAKLTGLASAMIGLVLTQTAILSFKAIDTTMANGFAGIIFGIAAAIIGFYMVARIWRLRLHKEHGTIRQNAGRLILAALQNIRRKFLCRFDKQLNI